MKSRKSKVFSYFLVLTLIFSLSIPGVAANAQPNSDDTSQKLQATAIYYNGDIVTVDENMSYAEEIGRAHV